jgi:hypothetical protein
MTREQLIQYLQTAADNARLPFFIERYFRTDEEWERVAAHDFRSAHLSSHAEITLQRVCASRAAIVLGEPGSGKSTFAKAALQRLIAGGMVPLFAQLRSYNGNLAALLSQSAPPELVTDPRVDGALMERVLVLDGVDEVPPRRLEELVADLRRTLGEDAHMHVLLTSRQAFYASHRDAFPPEIEPFYLLGFSERDVRAFIEHRGGHADAFLGQVETFRLWTEITNPFCLDVLYRMFVDTGHLGELRSQAVDHVVESLIASRPRVAADHQRRALRMLAVAMETAARNELSVEEAIQLLRTATTATADQAAALLDELTHSILIRTPNGIAFQMRSHGEYLAAVELSVMSLDRINMLVNYEHTIIPNESWRNCVSYLVELHAGAGRSFAIRNPDWVLAASPAAFSERDRSEVVLRLLNRLAVAGQYLRRHPFVSPAEAARFVTEQVRLQLTAEVTCNDQVRAANAMVLRGAIGDSAILDVALPIALDRTYAQLLRESAISAVAATADASMIPTLAGALDPDDPLRLSLVDCIGALTDAASIPTVLPILIATDAMVSSAFYRFRELRSCDAVEVFLAYLLANPTVVGASRLSSYTDPLWEAMTALWRPDWADRVAQLILEWERSQIIEQDVREALRAVERLSDGGESVARCLLTRLLASGETLFYFSWTVARWVTPSLADWLRQRPHSRGVMEMVAKFGSPDARRVLAPHLNGVVEAQDEAIAARQAAERQRTEQEDRRRRIQRDIVQDGDRFGDVLGALSRLSTKEWPTLSEERKAWLAEQCEQWLQQIDPLNSVRWISETQLSHHAALTWLVRVIGHYGLRIGNDVLVVQTMIAGEGRDVAGYHRRLGLSEAAVAEAERILRDPNTPPGAVYGLLTFVQEAGISTPALGIALMSVASDSRRPANIRSWAARLACSDRAIPDAELVDLAGRLDGTLRDEVERGLIERQHRPTIERRIATLLGDEAAMRAGDVPILHDGPLGWIGHIRNPQFWQRLVDLRAHALRLVLPNLASLISRTMASIDGVRLAAVVREQTPLAPAEWRDVQEMRAAEYEREARLRRAQATPFERVLQRLRGTTIGLFKIWCEGLTDGPTIEEFVTKLVGTAPDVEIVTDSLGGWRNILSPHWRPERLWDGCRDLVVLLDGDKGRDFRLAGHPLNADARRVEEKLAAAGIDLIVLERYAIENYFCENACVQVLGPAVSARFPLALDQTGNLGHSKNQNPEIARAMDITDIAGTDLLRVLEHIVERARV